MRFIVTFCSTLKIGIFLIDQLFCDKIYILCIESLVDLNIHLLWYIIFSAIQENNNNRTDCTKDDSLTQWHWISAIPELAVIESSLIWIVSFWFDANKVFYNTLFTYYRKLKPAGFQFRSILESMRILKIQRKKVFTENYSQSRFKRVKTVIWWNVYKEW